MSQITITFGVELWQYLLAQQNPSKVVAAYDVYSMFICFCKQQLLLPKIYPVIYLSQSQLLLAKTNEHRTTSRKAQFPMPTFVAKKFINIYYVLNICFKIIS